MAKLKTKKRIAIFGGTFSPIHKGHLMMAETARKKNKIDEVWFIPCGNPPHRQNKGLLPPSLRYKLVKSEIKGKKHFKALDIEIKKKTKSYTYQTVKKLISKYRLTPDKYELFFIVGQDEFEKLHTWKCPAKLSELVEYIVLPREKKKIVKPNVRKIKWKRLVAKKINISAEEIRDNLKNNKSISKLVSKEVEKELIKLR